MERRGRGAVGAAARRDAVTELFTRAHGRHLGLVYGGRSRRLRPILQMGNHVDTTWKARLADQLGHFTLELRRGYAASAMDDALALAGLTSLCALSRLLPERDPHPALYEVTLFVLGFLEDASVWPALIARWERAARRARVRTRSRQLRGNRQRRPALRLAALGARGLRLGRRALQGQAAAASAVSRQERAGRRRAAGHRRRARADGALSRDARPRPRELPMPEARVRLAALLSRAGIAA